MGISAANFCCNQCEQIDLMNIFLPTSRKVLPTSRHFAQLGSILPRPLFILPLSKLGQEMGCLGVGLGVFCVCWGSFVFVPLCRKGFVMAE